MCACGLTSSRMQWQLFRGQTREGKEPPLIKRKKKEKKGEKGGTTSLHMEIPDQSYSCPLSILTGTI